MHDLTVYTVFCVRLCDCRQQSFEIRAIKESDALDKSTDHISAVSHVYFSAKPLAKPLNKFGSHMFSYGRYIYSDVLEFLV